MRLNALTLLVLLALPAQIPAEIPLTSRDWDDATREVRRLAPGSFPSLPREVVLDLERRRCRVPQTYLSLDPHHVTSGSFRKSGQKDWAVLCSKNLESVLLVYWGGTADNVETVGEYSPDRGWLQDIGERRIGFSRYISTVGQAFILEHHARYGGTTPPPRIDHEGINQGFAEKASTVLYRHNGSWLKLAGAD
jgi:hypothetical protein